MSKKHTFFSFIVIFLGLFVTIKAFFFQHSRQIAITIDDLPLDMNPADALNATETIKKSLIKYQAPATGFIIANRIKPEYLPQLQLLLGHGLTMGSHTYSHPNLNKVSVQKYLDDLTLADKLLEPYMTVPRYFRYPYLATGTSTKKKAIENYLHQHHYIIAPVTIDSRDFVFNRRLFHLGNDRKHPDFAALKAEYLDTIWKKTIDRERRNKWLSWSLHSPKQILLLHANLLNAYLLDDVLQMYQSHGYRFITLEQALA